MEGEVITKGFGLIAFGTFFVWRGVDGWKQRRSGRLGLNEAATFNDGKVDALPANRWERGMTYVQPVLMLAFGPIMIGLGLILLTE